MMRPAPRPKADSNKRRKPDLEVLQSIGLKPNSTQATKQIVSVPLM